MKYPSTQIEELLLSEAELEAYFIVEASNLQSGLVHYVDREGANCWVFADERDDVMEDCIEFLKGRGNPAFANREEINAHIENLIKKYNESGDHLQ